MTPTYLHNLLPQPSQHTYATRHINNLTHIQSEHPGIGTGFF